MNIKNTILLSISLISPVFTNTISLDYACDRVGRYIWGLDSWLFKNAYKDCYDVIDNKFVTYRVFPDKKAFSAYDLSSKLLELLEKDKYGKYSNLYHRIRDIIDIEYKRFAFGNDKFIFLEERTEEPFTARICVVVKDSFSNSKFAINFIEISTTERWVNPANPYGYDRITILPVELREDFNIKFFFRSFYYDKYLNRLYVEKDYIVEDRITI